MPKTWICDPERNTACGKLLCFERGGPCGVTDDVRFALRDLTGLPLELVDDDFDKEAKQNGKDARQ